MRLREQGSERIAPRLIPSEQGKGQVNETKFRFREFRARDRELDRVNLVSSRLIRGRY